MSGPDQSEPIVDTTRSLKRKQLSADDQDELDALDSIFKRIKTAVPRTPYILSTPSLNPYRYYSQQQANAWKLGRLFKSEEEHLQYRTYLYREPCQDCFELQAGEDEEPEPEPPRSQTANGQPAKKKPNLSAFKVKQANGPNTPSVKISSPSLAPEKKQANGASKSEKLSAPSQKAEPKSPKSSSGTTRDENPTGKPRGAPSSNRPRAPSTTKSETTSSKGKIEKSDPSNSTPHGLPPLLSPVHEPMGNPYGLPNILSPTLPSNIQAELDRIEVQRKRADSDASVSSSDRKSQTLAVPASGSQQSNGTPKSENRARSVSIHGNGKSPQPEPVSQAEQTDSSMVVKLKFSKTKAPVVGQILRLPSKRANAEKKERNDTSKATPMADTQPKVTDPPVIKKKAIPKVAARQTATPSKVAEKRPRGEEETTLAVPPTKRPRAGSTQDRPITPLQNSQTQYATPKKDFKSVNMLRTQSSESNDATPGRSGATPAGVKPTSAPLNNKKQADISLLGHTSARWNQMGRALKHEATKILTSSKISKQDEKRAAVTNLECILAYMAAYFAQDLSLNMRGRAGEVEHTWKTLLPLCLSYSRSTKDLQHLDGLRSYLSSIIASAICTQVSQRCQNPKTHDSPQDATSQTNTAEASRQHNSLAENFALLSDHTIKMHRHYQDARIALPLEDLQSLYKKTYAARESNARLAREPEKLSGAKMSGPYFLPLGCDTTPIQAVRFGLRFLAEYCEIEGLKYSLRVNLERPE
ncbi:hypothetical protein BKA58DRAFT_341186 [Alternaria rosae]|uniref:uncharacterized protein n=1 Tax=Alternaria rosae TaxID=1187941 RepID=UPI001E8EDD9E|nr:uncharacterized protein BKA58DRAFT_341186 [Alternaria rosae]KAH6868762.1 hypothetical protein BKA58DRAFT_341186 [Alternaria rosae]